MTTMIGDNIFRATTATGAPLAGGKVYVLNSDGSGDHISSYPTYEDATNDTNHNPNPVILDARGEAFIVVNEDCYIKVYDADDNLLYESEGSLDSTVTQPAYVGGEAATGGYIRLYEQSTNGTDYITFKAPDSLASNVTLNLSYADGQTLYGQGGVDVSLVDGGTGYSLSNPGAARLFFWDDSAGHMEWLTPTGGLTLSGNTLSFTTAAITGGTCSGATLSASTFSSAITATGSTLSGGTLAPITPFALADGGTGVSLVDPNADRIMFWDDSAGQVTWLTPSTNVTISGTAMTIATPSLGGSANQIAYTSSNGEIAFESGIVSNGYLGATTSISLFSSSTAAKIKLYEDSDNGSNSYTIQAPAAISSNYTLTLPSSIGSLTGFLVGTESGSTTTLSHKTVNDYTEDTSPDYANDSVIYTQTGARSIRSLEDGAFHPSCLAAANSTTTVGSGVWTTVTLAALVFDSSGAFNTSTYRFVPLVAGYYAVIGGVEYSTLMTDATAFFAGISRNGSIVAYGGPTLGGATSTGAAQSSTLVYLNGSTDYVSLATYHTLGSNATVTTPTTFLACFLIRAD